MVKVETIPRWDLFSRVQRLEDSMFTKFDAKEMEERMEERSDRKMAEMEERSDRKMAEMEERSDMKMVEMENRTLVMFCVSSLIAILSGYIGRTIP